MTATRAITALYTSELLKLAVDLADYPLADDLPLRGDATSRTCGGTLALGLELDGSGAVARVGMRVTACAVGQAAAALFAKAACGMPANEIVAGEGALLTWVAGGDLPDWPGIAAIAAARDHPGRHGAILLPWRAARAALSNPRDAG